ncbi:diaminopimelate epimerase [Nitrosomonas supralitoralis]|uniref:Diaminopimelate epimerase n=1 Tax=Nitrosomonas supralitoralis TaxID=2116706 RepID=A0A2P7NZL0_9PROT|nr:diaminopimelate epimerase [Nitrosomonas supralitoralis]PSJ18913.1 diaminopimelate epimerase [Nitrosomonas supralitoralis]
MRIMATKMDGCGNSFLLVDEVKNPLPGFDRARISNALATQHDTDGILYVDQQQGMPTMKIFDRDGTEETMCGNGLRCATRYFRDTYVGNDVFNIITGDGTKEVVVDNESVEVNLGAARDYRKIDQNLHYVYTGVPHVVVIGSEISLEAARALGQLLRNDKSLCEFVGHPEGVNVNFIWRTAEGIALRTFEVGVEDVTQSCGTGSAASAYVAARVFGIDLPIMASSLGGRLRVRNDNGGLSISGPTRYQGKVIGFANAVFARSVEPVGYWQRNYAWQGM